MWTFNVSAGILSHDGAVAALGVWSGHDEGRNNQAMEAHANLGPIPRGEWLIGDLIQTTESHGPYVLPLTPAEGTDTYGRGGFLIHGASAISPMESSRGCLIVPRSVRLLIAESGDKMLEVV